jgi:hypothetical protein
VVGTLVVPTLDFRLARMFWGVDDVRLAARMHAVVGGPPLTGSSQ